jgi:hypothetical protein
MLVAAILAPLSCTNKQPVQSTYFDTTISPILESSCVHTNTGASCHVADPNGNAVGNLDVSTYLAVSHRRDLLQVYGPYPQPALLLKNIAPISLNIQAFDGQTAKITTDIKHSGLQILDQTGGAFATLRKWIGNGATENNSGLVPIQLAKLPCVSTDPDMNAVPFKGSGFDPTQINRNAQDYQTFSSQVVPIIHSTCASSNCHGVRSNNLFLVCGDTPAQVDWDYFVASQYLSTPPQVSELLRRPLAPAQGGSYHEGGIVFANASDPNYQALLQFATQHGAATFSSVDPNLGFFAHKVQPILVKKGCMQIQCHSAAMFHEYRLRGGSGGAFSYYATLKNYDLSLAMLALESDDVNASRLVRKNLFRAVVGGLLPPPPGGTGGGADAGDASGSSDTGATDTGASDTGGAPDAGPPPPPPAGGTTYGLAHRGGPLF